MWKQIAEWSAQGVVRTLVSSAVVGAGVAVWEMMDMETLVGIVCLVVLFFCTFFGLKLLHVPIQKFTTQGEYDALKVLGKINERTIYMIMEEKKPREK